ncbi:MAG: tetratricopeptide repeat protein, partial [Candidatus Aminicenantes bacterium]|nr:tetratricopeptide repeat protein [Candidatus Aminicenantes bacterium]
HLDQYAFYLQILHEKALIALELDDLQSFEQQLKELKTAGRRGAKRQALRRYYHLLGQRELKDGRISRAITNFEKALSLQSFQNPLSDFDLHRYYFSLAGAYEQAGNLEKARATYEQLTRLNKLEFGDMYARSYYRLGKIYEQLREKAKAIENYRKFLDLWKEADPIFSEVPDARLRLAGLVPR